MEAIADPRPRLPRVTDDLAPPALLDLTIDAGPTTVIALSGELDPATAPTLEKAVAGLVADESVSHVVLDLSAVSFLDSSGLRALVSSRDQLAARGATMALRRPTANTRRVLDITGLSDAIDVE